MLFLPKAILFDHDGVLVASESLHQEAWWSLFKELQIPATPEDIHGGIGTTAPQILRNAFDKYQPGWTEDQYRIPQLTDRKNEIYRSLCPTRLKTYPGIPEGLKWLRSQGIRAIIVSNARHLELRQAIELLSLSEFLADAISREDVSHPKPHPEMFELALARHRLLPQECIAIDDSPPGLLGALRAGIPAVGVTTNFKYESLALPSPQEPQRIPMKIYREPAEFFLELQSLANAK